ncbi:MAG: cytosine permease [Clostridia bacterium]|jgi:NCS1 family nucleobase:cation symporter-1|nr:cytosine permease [Clostridia bacterium]MDD4665509.1 cytosine permease [Clostridia bacterium]
MPTKKQTENQVANEVYYGIIPILRNERIYGFWDVFFATTAWAIASWCYVQGGYIATMLGAKALISNTIFGMTIAGIFLCFTVLISTRYGIDLWIYQKALFGYKAVLVIAAITIASNYGYEAINVKLYANSLMILCKSAGLTLSEAWNPWIGMTCVLLGWWIALIGPKAIGYTTKIMVPSSLIVGVIILILLSAKCSLAELAAINPVRAGSGSNWERYMLVMELNVAFVIAWYPLLGVLPRLVKSERASYWGHLAGFAIIQAVVVSIGALTGLVMSAITGVESTNPTEWLIVLGGPWWGGISLILISIANVTAQAIAIYSVTVSTKVLMPSLDYKKVATFWSAWCALLVFWGGIWDYYQTYIAIIGAICGPAVALILVDFYIIRKQKISIASLFQSSGKNAYTYTNGYNLPAIIAFASGIASYFLVYDPVNLVPKSKIFLYTTATGLSMLVSAGIYWGFSLLKPVNNYLRKDCQEE